jgi:hypothetical protein
MIRLLPDGRVVELLVQHVVQLLPRAGLHDQRVPEGLHGERLGVRHLADRLAPLIWLRSRLAADAAGVHERRHRAAEVVGRSPRASRRRSRRPSAAHRGVLAARVSRAERMSAVIVPTTRFASGAESVVYLSRIACARVRRHVLRDDRLLAVAAVTTFDGVDREVDVVITRPNDAALVTSLPAMCRRTAGACGR